MSSYQPAVEGIPMELRRMWERLCIEPIWENPNGAIEHVASERPHIWRWEAVLPMLMETAKVSSPALLERRIVVLAPPDKAGKVGTVGLLTSTFQTLLPGERARPHRHTMDALRFALDGDGAQTFVDGKPCPMLPGDLILTPGWTWHEHVHEGDQPVVWLDILNLPLHHSLGTIEFQPGPRNETPLQYDDATFAVANVRPVLDWAGRRHSPVFRYPWTATAAALDAAPEAPDGSRRVRYVNPVNGGPCMDLVDCTALQLAPSLETAAFRSSASAICSVIDGEGETVFEDGSRLAWAARDVFTVPQRQFVTHKAGRGGARLFFASDRSAYERLGLLKEEYAG